MARRVTLHPSFVLHARPFRDTSAIVDFFTFSYGRVTAVVRGVRSAKSKIRGLLMPFIPLLVSWSGKGELQTVNKLEPQALSYKLVGRCLLSGLYLNELIVKCLRRNDPYPELYAFYQHTLSQLESEDNLQLSLRLFEKRFFQETGYGLQLDKTTAGAQIIATEKYRYMAEHGFVITNLNNGHDVFSGSSLLALNKEKLITKLDFVDAKKLTRLVLEHLLGGVTLKSRELF